MEEQLQHQSSVHSSHHGKRVSDTSGHLGGEWAALPPSVALWVSVGVTGPLAVSAFLDPGFGDGTAGCRPPAGSNSGVVVYMDPH